MGKVSKILLTGAMIGILSTSALAANHLVTVDIWNAHTNQPSMGNIATDNNEKALYNDTKNTLEIATNPVDVSGYFSGIQAARYDATGKGNFVDVKVLSTSTVETGTKNDGTNHTVKFLSSFEIPVPSYLTKTGVEYIPLQMSVPHTPMDVVVGTGYLDARLRIDWNQMETSQWVTIEPNTEISAGTVEQLTFSSNGIKVMADTTVLASDCQMTTTVITSGKNYELAKKALGNTNFHLYDISVTLSGHEATPTGSLEVQFPYSKLSNLYRINPDGSKTVLRGSTSNEGYSILSRSLGLFAVVGGEKMEAHPFTDIHGHWAESTIATAVEKGLFNGTAPTLFSPEAPMTCGMVITVLHRMAGSPAVTATSNVWYGEAMAWGYNCGIIGGYKTFDGNANVTREELATMLHRFDGGLETANLSKFTDNSAISTWAKDGLSWANAKGIVTGKTATTIAPQANATRAEVATMLLRYQP